MKLTYGRIGRQVSIAVLSLYLAANAAVQATFYVSPTGTGDYSQASPGSLSGIQAKVRSVNTNMTGNIVVYLKGGVYTLTSPMNFGPADGGSGNNWVRYINAPGEKPIISGGRQVTGWSLSSGTIWKASLPGVNKKIRNMFVNGVRANMAKGPNVWGQGHTTATYNGQPDDIRFSSASPCTNCPYPSRGAIVPVANPKYVEIRQKSNGGWNEQTWCVRDMVSSGGFTVVKMQQPYWSICSANNMWDAQPQDTESGTMESPNWYDRNEGFDFYNAIEFLDTAGEFYYDVPATTLYYVPRANEILTSANTDVEVALVEGLVNVKGVDLTNRVQNLQFWGITFEYADWLMYRSVSGADASYGCAGAQATQMLYGDANPDQLWQHMSNSTTPLAAINVESAKNIDFEWNVIKHTGSIGVSLKNDVSNCTLAGNLIYDIGGAGINVGSPADAFIGDSSSTAPQEYGPTREGTCANLNIANNLVYATSKQFLSHPAITTFLETGLTIAHNEVHDCPYSGISMGWTWCDNDVSTTTNIGGNNHLDYNKIYDAMKVLIDGGSIYTLGKQPNSTILKNYAYAGGSAIYLDCGSDGFAVSHNWLEPDAMCGLNDGSGICTFTDNPTTDATVKDSAGLQSCYRTMGSEPIAPLPGDVTCAVTATSTAPNTMMSILRPAAARMMVFDVQGRLLARSVDRNFLLRNRELSRGQSFGSGLFVVRRESAQGPDGAQVISLAK